MFVAAHAALQVGDQLMQEMLAGDALSLLQTVPLTADRAHGHLAMAFKDDCDVEPARAANHAELVRHTASPSTDSAQRL
jgi:hypothetical protein